MGRKVDDKIEWLKTFNAAIGERVRTIREAKGITTTELAFMVAQVSGLKTQVFFGPMAQHI